MLMGNINLYNAHVINNIVYYSSGRHAGIAPCGHQRLCNFAHSMYSGNAGKHLDLPACEK